MALTEFSLIERYFKALTQAIDEPKVHLGIGDDCALLGVTPEFDLAVSVDTLVAGVHFPEDAPAEQVGYRALAASLSDLAAVGARPLGFTLALTLPVADEHWLADFAQGLGNMAINSGIPLVGGDTTRGPLSISIQVMGEVPKGGGLLRSGAVPGDEIYVTGTLGDSAGGLKKLAELSSQSYLYQRFYRPEPRLLIGQKLIGWATSAIDISDGLLADLGHILNASGVGAWIDAKALPLSSALRSAFAQEECLDMALCGGEDFELCFTLPAEQRASFLRAVSPLPVPVTRIGLVLEKQGLEVAGWKDGIRRHLAGGYSHF